MAKRNITWNLDDEISMTVNFKSGEKETFRFNDILGFNDMPEELGVCFELFRHGLKQKLADSVAGMAKAGSTPEEQIDTMLKVWSSICKGEFTVRKAAVPKMTKAEAIAKLGDDATDEQLALVELLF